MADVIWKAPAVNWVDDEGKNGQVKVTTLHYTTSLIEDIYAAAINGTTPDGKNRVYTKPALEAVPESVVIGWVKQALGQEEVDRIEQVLRDNVAEQKTPTSGTVNPGSDDGPGTLPA